MAKHKDVSRLMDLIDEIRSTFQLTLASELPEMNDSVDGRNCETAAGEHILLDSFDNTPLKLYYAIVKTSDDSMTRHGRTSTAPDCTVRSPS
jgi:hypothetical protein